MAPYRQAVARCVNSGKNGLSLPNEPLFSPDTPAQRGRGVTAATEDTVESNETYLHQVNGIVGLRSEPVRVTESPGFTPGIVRLQN